MWNELFPDDKMSTFNVNFLLKIVQMFITFKALHYERILVWWTMSDGVIGGPKCWFLCLCSFLVGSKFNQTWNSAGKRLPTRCCLI